jgi:ethanolamine ammonia-lyase small subunit
MAAAPDPLPPDPWQQLRRLTPARIALGRAGGSVPTRELLEFRLAHARARDAVHAPFDADGLAARLRGLGVGVLGLQSAARSPAEFLRRPDLGRKLAAASRDLLLARDPGGIMAPSDLVIIVSDGLSSVAAREHAPPLLEELVPLALGAGWKLAPLIVASRGRVALQDEIGGLLHARLSLLLLGERPGLSAADSLGAYFTFSPRPGLTDAARNCVSNIRPEGLPARAAARKLFHLLTQSRQRHLSGVALKDDLPSLSTEETPEKTLPRQDSNLV